MHTSPSHMQHLVRHIAAEDSGAFSELYDLLSVRIVLELLSLARSPADADAITSATLVEMWSMARFHSADTDVDAWVASIVARRAADRDPGGDLALDQGKGDARQPWCVAITDNDRQTLLTLAALLTRPALPVGYSPGPTTPRDSEKVRA